MIKDGFWFCKFSGLDRFTLKDKKEYYKDESVVWIASPLQI